jgi:two-component system sensor histidine kinase HydH
MGRMRIVSLGLAVISFAALSVVDMVIFRGMAERSRLESRNDLEQTFNILFTALRGHDEFGAAIDADPSLKSKVVGFGLYDASGGALYRWGEAPETAAPPATTNAEVANGMAREYRENSSRDSIVLLLKTPTDRPPPPRAPDGERPTDSPGPRYGRGFAALFKANVIYLEVRQPRFWWQQRLRAALLPVAEFLLAGAVAAVTMLLITNRAYRQRIEQQKNLVMLGTAASTIAHEIKNPLLAIRLQSSIIARTVPGQAARELGIIDAEVERLSMLSGRVNDFLRDPVGNPSRIDPAEIASETGLRLLGRPLVRAQPDPACTVIIDPERLRSILENLVRNAMESGGSDEEVAIEIGRDGGTVRVDVVDRGGGVAPGDRERVFDPFFTTKSRGTGIGLAICLRFAKAVGGNVELLARADGGTRARLTLAEARA